MRKATFFTPPAIEGDEEHIVRRLGWAVVRCWPDLPPAVREAIQTQAGLTSDAYQTVQLREQIAIFLRQHGEAGD